MITIKIYVYEEYMSMMKEKLNGDIEKIYIDWTEAIYDKKRCHHGYQTYEKT